MTQLHLVGFTPDLGGLALSARKGARTGAYNVIVAMVGAIPRHRPVVVASNDRRVQTEASQAGANVISSDQLLAIIGR